MHLEAPNMYSKNANQLTLIEDFFQPFNGYLNKNNRWVILSKLIPWNEFEETYAENFKPTRKGEKAFPVRVALGALIIQTKMKLADAEVPEMIMENPYLQFFLGFKVYDDQKKPFHSSLLTHFRKRLSPDIMIEINELIIQAELDRQKEDNSDDSRDENQGGAGDKATIKEIESGQISPDELEHHGKLILDATCTPSDIRYPTDLHLLNNAREILEGHIDKLHEPDVGIKAKPRTYRNQARKQYLKVEKLRKKP